MKKNNVINLFGDAPEDGDIQSFDDANREQMLSTLDAVKDQVSNNIVTGIIVITIGTDKIYGGESYVGGAGVWGAMDRAIGLIELVKYDLVKEVNSKSSG